MASQPRPKPPVLTEAVPAKGGVPLGKFLEELQAARSRLELLREQAFVEGVPEKGLTASAFAAYRNSAWDFIVVDAPGGPWLAYGPVPSHSGGNRVGVMGGPKRAIIDARPPAGSNLTLQDVLQQVQKDYPSARIVEDAEGGPCVRVIIEPQGN